MAKRFTATEIWSEDWYLSMPNEYKLFWFYMLSTCDHAGLFKVNWRSFSGLVEVNLSSSDALDYFNAGKQRVRVIKSSLWFIEDFFVYQYGTTFNLNNRLHASIAAIYFKHQIDLTSIRGLLDLKQGVKDKDKELSIGDIYVKDGKRENLLLPRMMAVFMEANPEYPRDDESDLRNCLNISHKIADKYGWMHNTVTNGRMEDVLKSWQTIVDFAKKHDHFSKLSITGLHKQWQGLVQTMINEKPKTTNEKKITV